MGRKGKNTRRERSKGIFCLEGEWWNDLRHQSSVRPLLTMLSELEPYPRYIHRTVGTREGFDYYLGKWTQKRFASYPILYLAFEGEPKTIFIGDQRRSGGSVSLDEIAEKLSGHCRKRIIHVGACETLKCDRRHLTRFLRETKALAVCGFTTSVDWVQSASFELMILSALQRRSRTVRGMRATLKDIRSMAGGLARDLAFRMVINT